MTDNTYAQLRDQLQRLSEEVTFVTENVGEEAVSHWDGESTPHWSLDPLVEWENEGVVDEVFPGGDVSIVDWVNYSALEVVEIAERSSGDPDWRLVGLRIVITTGGPHVEIEITNHGTRGVVQGYWGGDLVKQRLSSAEASAIFDALDSSQW